MWAAVASAVAVAVVLVAGTLLHARRAGEQAGPAAGPVVLTVYNVEVACQQLRTMECALTLAKDPTAPYSVTAATPAGRVWHGDRLIADCVTSDGQTIVDEQGMSSSRWYHVTVPATGVTGWLPGVRTRNRADIPQCRAVH